MNSAVSGYQLFSNPPLNRTIHACSFVGFQVTLVGPGLPLPLTPSTTVSPNPAEALAALSLSTVTLSTIIGVAKHLWCLDVEHEKVPQKQKDTHSHGIVKNTLFFLEQAKYPHPGGADGEISNHPACIRPSSASVST